MLFLKAVMILSIIMQKMFKIFFLFLIEDQASYIYLLEQIGKSLNKRNKYRFQYWIFTKSYQTEPKNVPYRFQYKEWHCTVL